MRRHRLSDPVQWPLLTHPDDPHSLEASFVGTLLPLAKSLRLCDADETLESITRRLKADFDLPPNEVRAFAIKLFYMSAMFVEVTALRRGQEFVGAVPVEQVACQLFSECHGFLMAMREQALANTRRGANGRRIIGAASREKVRREAIRFMQIGLSKERAAPEIAEAVSLSPGTVRKLLSELFPGALWTCR